MGQIYLISEGLTREASHQFKQSNTDVHQQPAGARLFLCFFNHNPDFWQTKSFYLLLTAFAQLCNNTKRNHFDL